ncbi:hypothetical protein GWO43_25785 [candidate division KSB1 bacterium]|nr:hypothetical protein [candidate division KSB1 bacterium]NIR69224.1 hypothetical protein [candidate division KSB1 bacterium]NIS27398.1 hypothetical protein [candidate division KSB1 bacterium]NIT74223.1 hypothetical protein [candidate division KSB1 bacterium]NIU28115.1 hypothetical protein [candidate division KSB1 bacterium]
MATNMTRFKRKLSAEEIRENFIMIQKKELDFFPKVGKPFKLKINDKTVDTYVTAVECWCQGPNKPHSHYRIDVTPFRDKLKLQWGTKVVIEKQGDKKYKVVS